MSHSAVLTVGSTRFDHLVAAALSPSSLAALSSLGVTQLLAQVGNSTLPLDWMEGSTVRAGGLRVEVVRFLRDLEERVGEADVVVSHAGAGSILSFLRPLPPPASSHPPSDLDTCPHRQLVLVPNSTLMDSHQADLADEMENKGWAVVCREPRQLSETLQRLSNKVRVDVAPEDNYPALDKGQVQRILDEALGFA
ncbi:hypothetical protein JCM3770_004723 [Rhodotorula araucariae]